MPELESLGSIPLAMVAIAILFAAAAGIGRLVLRPLEIGRWHPCDAFLLRFSVGLTLVGVAGVTLGQAGLLDGGRSAWLLVGLSLLSTPMVWQHFRLPAQGDLAAIAEWVRRLPWVGVLAAAVAMITLGPALCYPTGWDELVYHEVLPQRWLVEGQPAVYLDLPYSGFPSCGEILFWLMAPIEGVIAPRLLMWTCWILGLIGIFRLLRQRMRAASAILLTLAFTLNDTVLLISANCYVESMLLLNVAALLLALGLPPRSATDRAVLWRAIVLGVLAGGAAAVKLTGCAVLVVPCLWFVGQACVDRARRRAVALPLAIYLAVALLVGFPFYLRPWRATGNPFYPYLCSWFTDDPLQLEMSRHHHLLGGFTYGVKSLLGFVEAPWLLAFRSENYDGEFGWQLLVMVVLAIVAMASVGRRRQRWLVLWPFAVALWFYVFWFATAQQARFAVPVMIPLLVLAGTGLHLLRRSWRLVALLSLAAATLASVPWGRSDYYRASWLTVAGRFNHSDYVHNITDRVYLPLIQAIHALTPADAKLMLLFEHRGFYVLRPYTIGTPLFQEGPFSPPERYAEMSYVVQVLAQNGITHVAMAKADPGPDQAPGWFERQQPLLRGLEDSVRHGRLQPIWESAEYVLMEVR